MTLRNLPEIKMLAPAKDLAWETRSDALAKWPETVRAAIEGDNSISIYEQIGEDPWTGGGVTSKRIAGALRAIGEQDVTVNLNSPGGDFFEGVAIYNMLREHKGKVNVRIVGLAASAASVIAMAGDRIEIGRASFMMIHNAWAMAVGNRHDMLDVADTLETFDAAMADVYAARTGAAARTIGAMMDAETWIAGSDAVAQGFADALLPADATTDSGTKADSRRAALRTVEAALADKGMTRADRRNLLKELRSGMPGAVAVMETMPGAGQDEWIASALKLAQSLNGDRT